MGRAYKNFWSLNTDEAVVIGILRDSTPKNIEVLMPLNAQMKDIDLVLMNMVNKKTLKIQVKGSRAFEPRKSEIAKYGDGSAGWFYFSTDVIFKSTADYFIFLIYVLEKNEKSGRRNITPHTLIISTDKLKKLCKKYKKIGKGNRFNFLFWVNPIKKEAIEYRDQKYYVSECLDNKGFLKLKI